MIKFLVILGYSIVYILYAHLWFHKIIFGDVMAPIVKPGDILLDIAIVVTLFMIYIFPKILFTVLAQKCKTYRARYLVMAIPLFLMFDLALSHNISGRARNFFSGAPLCYDPVDPICVYLPPLAERWHEFFAYDCVQILFYILFTLIYFHVADQKKKKTS